MSRPAAPGPGVRARGSRRGDLLLAAAGTGLGASLALGIRSVRHGLEVPGGKLLAAGTLAALGGTYLCLMALLLVSRLPWLEREVGHDRMLMLHRRVAPYALGLIGAHVVLTTVSYAQAADRSVLGEGYRLVTRSPWMLPAATAFALMVALAVLSARAVRRRMSYETWWVTHLYFYLAVALSLGHQLVLGPMFAAHGAAWRFWIGLYVLVAALIGWSRVLLPLWTSLRHRLRIAAVVPESDDVVSVYVAGRRLDRLGARGGQFFQWRFLTRQWWWQAHPYSLSAVPDGSLLRITVKDLGDQSAGLRRLRPGTRVVAEGPYGVFTADARHGHRVTAFAAGVGITPIRALLEDLPADCEVTVVHRAPDPAAAPLAAELLELVHGRGWRLLHLSGPRAEHPLTPGRLLSLVPGLADSDVYVCGPDGFADAVRAAVREVGVPAHRLHHEAFAF